MNDDVNLLVFHHIESFIFTSKSEVVCLPISKTYTSFDENGYVLTSKIRMTLSTGLQHTIIDHISDLPFRQHRYIYIHKYTVRIDILFENHF